MPVKIVNKEPVEYYSNLEAGLDLSSPLNLNQNLLNQQQQQQSHAETFLDLYKNSPTTRDYNINVNADLANRISGGLGSVPVVGGALSTMADVAMPAAAFIGSPIYDTLQGAYRGIKDPNKSVLEAIKGENIGSTMWERMVGASAPLSERLSNWKDTLGTYGKAFAGEATPKELAAAQSKGPLYVDPNLSYEDFPLTELEKDLRYASRGEREEIYEDMKKDLEGMTDEEKKDYLHYNQEPAMMADPYITQAMEYTGDPVFEDYYETGEHWSSGIPRIQQQLIKKRKQRIQKSRQAEAAKKKVITTTPKGPPSITQIKKHKAPGGSGYGPHTKPKYKPPQQTGGGGGVHSGMKTTKTSAPKKSKSYQQASYARRGKADGGLINFFKNGGFLG